MVMKLKMTFKQVAQPLYRSVYLIGYVRIDEKEFAFGQIINKNPKQTQKDLIKYANKYFKEIRVC